jgi:hypothetical protein
MENFSCKSSMTFFFYSKGISGKNIGEFMFEGDKSSDYILKSFEKCLAQ